MELYKNLRKISRVNAYEITNDSITILFRGGKTYVYNYDSAGSSRIEVMKRLAASGHGLNSFINKHARKHYAKKYSKETNPHLIIEPNNRRLNRKNTPWQQPHQEQKPSEST